MSSLLLNFPFVYIDKSTSSGRNTSAGSRISAYFYTYSRNTSLSTYEDKFNNF